MKSLRSVCRTGLRPALLGLVLGIVAYPAGAADASPAADLGEGLRYYRVHAVPAELPAAAQKPGPSVVDLRSSQLAPGSAAALEAWLRFRSARTTPVFILVNGGTAPELAAVLAANRLLPGVLIVGLPAPGLTPDIVAATTAAADERAYAAKEHGTSLRDLLTENADKPRADEAAIMRDRSNPPDDADENGPADDTEGPVAPTDGEKPAPVIDTVLQKAVQLHRALLALKRL
jgi:hypothetical protein